MTRFAAGTSPQYADAYNNWFFGGGFQRGDTPPSPGGQMPFNRAVQAPYPPTSSGPMPMAPPRPSPPTPSKPGPGRPSRPMAPTQPPPPGKPQGGGFAAYSPGQAQPQQSPWATSTPYGQPQQQPANRPPPFRATSQNFDGTQSQMPNFRQRDAFISQINSQLGQMQQQSQQRPGMGPPQFNFPQMWGQAGQMAQQGWQNPFAAPGYY